MMARMTPHARRQCETRSIDPRIVEARAVAECERLTRARSAAVLVARLPEHRGGLVGSNGNTVWAIVRDGEVVTVMLRRDNQPATREALHVDYVAV